MAKAVKLNYICQSCHATSSRWSGKCASCGAWNSLIEETKEKIPPVGGISGSKSFGHKVALEKLAHKETAVARIITNLTELDRVTGGGIVPGAATLIGGEPGIGKSTLLLQLAAALASQGLRIVYFCGEEATAQVRIRAERLNILNAPIELASETNLGNIIATLSNGPMVDLVIIDSIQTLWSDNIEAAPGTISQVRAASQTLIRFAKQKTTALVLVGHITKEGQIAGPKVVEHMVDTVLYFEGDRGHPFRLLRTVKNRFGATDEIGVFEMSDSGLRQVENPSELFLGERDATAPGAAVFAGIEGTRPILVEIQALVAPSSLGTPRRTVVGWESSRLSMILAVLDARCGISFSQHDVYLNVAGGLKITEPAADLAAAAALLSSFSGNALPTDHIYFGEISLSGTVRATGHVASRLREAGKLGFQRAVLSSAGDTGARVEQMKLYRIKYLKELAVDVSTCE
ncbi:MAG TPA: DNA repair protein RadA [Hyphomicrobiaceae bacterium MAG_BT-2024]